MDAPFLGIGAALSPAAELETVRGIFTQPIGAGRPQAGATRQDIAGFEIIDTVFEHVDPLTAFEGPDNPVPAAIEAFLLRNSEEGVVDVP
jgi:hypothetical protein